MSHIKHSRGRFSKNVGVTTFFVEDINGVGIGWEVQGAYFGTDGISIANIETNPSSPDYKLITLSSGITRAFLMVHKSQQ